MLIVTIDSGTTNTRIRVWKDNNKIITESIAPVGVRDTAITGNNKKLTAAIRDLLAKVLNTANIKDSDDYFIVASGMITSDVGLCNIPHLIAPVGIYDFAKHIVKKVLPEITSHPIWFIPGVKNDIQNVTLQNCEQMDIMRGEEVETLGILSLLDIHGSALIILPGSHSKFVKINANNQIISCTTTLSGELLDIITKQTILASSLKQQFATSIEEEYLLSGANYCQRVGLPRACFSIRILDLFNHLTLNQKANFLLGAVLYSDILTIKNSQALAFKSDSPIVISGKAILCEALTKLIQHDDYFTGEIIACNEDEKMPLSSLGAIAVIHELKKTLNNHSN